MRPPTRKFLLPLLLQLLLLPDKATSIWQSRAGSCVNAGFDLKAADVCNGRQSIVLSEEKPLVSFNDHLPAASCNLSILIPVTTKLPGARASFSRLRYLAVRMFHPTPVELFELTTRRDLCLEVSFRLRLQAGPEAAASGTSASAQEKPLPLSQRRSCVTPERHDAAWLFEELPLHVVDRAIAAVGAVGPKGNGTAPVLNLVAEFSWQLISRNTGAPMAGPGPGPLWLAFSVAPFFDCAGARNLGRYVHCQSAGSPGEDLCVTKSLACCSPVVRYLECPKRTVLASSIMECALYNYDVGFYLFLVVAGTVAVSTVLLCLLVPPVLAAAKGYTRWRGEAA